MERLKKHIMHIGLIVLIAGSLVWVVCQFFMGEYGRTAVVKVSGKTVHTLNLNQDKTVYVGGKNDIMLKVIISDGYIYVEHSDCPDKICEKKGKISKTNENIVCLPAETVIEVYGEDKEAEIDAVA